MASGVADFSVALPGVFFAAGAAVSCLVASGVLVSLVEALSADFEGSGVGLLVAVSFGVSVLAGSLVAFLVSLVEGVGSAVGVSLTVGDGVAAGKMKVLMEVGNDVTFFCQLF